MKKNNKNNSFFLFLSNYYIKFLSNKKHSYEHLLKYYIFFLSYKEVLLQLSNKHTTFDSLILLYCNKISFIYKYSFYSKLNVNFFLNFFNLPILILDYDILLKNNILNTNTFKKNLNFYFFFLNKYINNLVTDSSFSIIELNNLSNLFFFIIYTKQIILFMKKTFENLNTLFLYKSFFFKFFFLYKKLYSSYFEYNYYLISNKKKIYCSLNLTNIKTSFDFNVAYLNFNSYFISYYSFFFCFLKC